MMLVFILCAVSLVVAIITCAVAEQDLYMKRKHWNIVNKISEYTLIFGLANFLLFVFIIAVSLL